MGAAAEVPELLLAAVAEVVVPDPELVAVLVPLGEAALGVDATEEVLEAPDMLEEPEEQTTEEGTVTPAVPQSCCANFTVAS